MTYCASLARLRKIVSSLLGSPHRRISENPPLMCRLVVLCHRKRPPIAAVRADQFHWTVKRVLDIYLCWFLLAFRDTSSRKEVALSEDLANSDTDRPTTWTVFGSGRLLRLLLNFIFDRLINNHDDLNSLY